MALFTRKDFWKENSNYIKTDRLQSLVVYENELYLCIESHMSTNTFDSDKFTKVASNENAVSVIDYIPQNITLDLETSTYTVNMQEINMQEIIGETITTYNDMYILINSSTELDNTLYIDFNNIDFTKYTIGQNFYIQVISYIDLTNGLEIRYNNEGVYDYITSLNSVSSYNKLEFAITNAGVFNNKPVFKLLNQKITVMPS